MQETIIAPVQAPVNADDFPFPQYLKEMETYPVTVYNYTNAFVTPSGVCFNLLGMLLPGTFMKRKRNKRDQMKIALYYYLTKKKIGLKKDKTYLVIHNQWSINGFYHWIADSMPRLWSVKEKLTEVVLLLPEQAKSIAYIQGTLSLFPQLAVEYLGASKVAFLKKLTVPTHLPSWGLLEPKHLASFSEYAINKVSPDQRPGGLIYITRKKASRRKVSNEEELMQALLPFGFEEVALEDLTFSEQVKLFNSAKIVISIHGAALSNLVFMQKGSAVIELLKSESENITMIMEYQKLASVSNPDYYYVPSPPVNNEGYDSADLKIDIPYVQALVQKIIHR